MQINIFNISFKNKILNIIKCKCKDNLKKKYDYAKYRIQNLNVYIYILKCIKICKIHENQEVYLFIYLFCGLWNKAW